MCIVITAHQLVAAYSLFLMTLKVQKRRERERAYFRYFMLNIKLFLNCVLDNVLQTQAMPTSRNSPISMHSSFLQGLERDGAIIE
jgi:hypothetical protein